MTSLWTHLPFANYVDAVACSAYPNNPELARAALDETGKVLYSLLGHILVNPSRTEETEAILASYVFPNSTNVARDIVNNTYARAEEFVTELCRRAIREGANARRTSRARDGSTDDPRPLEAQRLTSASSGSEQTYILTGARGTGKTFFLNYLLSQFSTRFDADRIVWIRVNLVDNFFAERVGRHTKELDLAHWIYGQCAKVLMRYYDGVNSKVCPPARRIGDRLDTAVILNESIESDAGSSEGHKQFLRESLAVMTRTFWERAVPEEPISAGLVPKSLGLDLVKATIRAGYNFVIVLDGLDRLEATAWHLERFVDLLEATNKLVEAQNQGVAFVVVMRDESWIGTRAWSAQRQLNAFHDRNVVRYRVAAAPLKETVQARMAFVRRKLATNADIAVAWHHRLALFEKDLAVNGGFRSVIKALGDNRRSQMQGVQARFLDVMTFPESGDEQYSHIESLMRSGRMYPGRPYKYVREPGVGGDDYEREPARDRLERRFGSDVVRDNYLWPSVFWFPYVEGAQQGRNVDGCPRGVLLGLRILQLIRANREEIRHRRTADALTGWEIAKLCNELFAYPKESVLALVEEYEQYEFIAMAAESGHFGAERRQYSITGKGEHILDSLIVDPDYLHMSAMRMPVWRNAVEDEELPLFKAVSLGPDGSAANLQRRNFQGERDWLSGKVCNVLGMSGLVNAANLEQQAVFERNIANILDGRLRGCAAEAGDAGTGGGGMFAAGDRITEAVERYVAHTLASWGEGRAAIEDMVQRFYVKWNRAPIRAPS